MKSLHLPILASILALSFAGPASAAPDPFQRYLKIKNDSPITMYPVIQVPLAANGGGDSDKRVERLYINRGGPGLGIPSGQTVTVNIPKNGVMPFRWYQAGRVFLFSVDPRELEKRVGDPAMLAKRDGQQPPNPCPAEVAGSCWTGIANAAFWEDAPAQIVEYTAISKDWSGTNMSGTWPDQDDTRGVPFLDIDVSYVDDAYLPAAMGLDDTGATKFMGTTLDLPMFKRRMQAFLKSDHVEWQNYAAYSEKNWPNNYFHDLVARYSHIPSGYKILWEPLNGNLSALYSPQPDDGAPAQCGAWPGCSKLDPQNLCCPTGDGTILGCCGLINFSVDNTSKVGAGYSNPSLEDMYARWAPWIDGTPCADISKITSWPSDKPAFNKQAFCDAFQATVKWVWDLYLVDPYTVNQCKAFSAKQQKYCTLASVVGYKSGPQGGRQPESVQALLRSLPWGDGMPMGTLQYQWDKFLHYWAPPESIFNLNPFIPFIKANRTGIRAKSGYSFSIDDQWGNYQDLASGAIIDIGGETALLNRESFDPYQQYRLSLPAGWHHATVCGRPIELRKQGQPITFSFWKDGARIPFCDIVLYPKVGNTLVFKYRLVENTSTVVDQWTGLDWEVQGFKAADATFCTQNTSPTLQYLCATDQTKLEPKFPDNNGGGLEVVYVSLMENQRPIVSMTMPPPPP
jgi:hypothetical protein